MAWPWLRCAWLESAASPSTDAIGVLDFRRLGTDLADNCGGTFSLIQIQLNVI